MASSLHARTVKILHTCGTIFKRPGTNLLNGLLIGSLIASNENTTFRKTMIRRRAFYFFIMSMFSVWQKGKQLLELFNSAMQSLV